MADTRSITRRRFLRRTAAAGAAPVFAPTIVPCSVLGGEGNVAPSNRVTVGMIGLGRQAIAHNLPVFARAADAEVVALCDVDRWRAEFSKENPAAVAASKQRGIDLDKMQGCFRTTDFREVLGRADVDAVMITTPDHWHVPIALAAVKAGKDMDATPIFVCAGCGHTVLGEAPDKCPVCGAPKQRFSEIK